MMEHTELVTRLLAVLTQHQQEAVATGLVEQHEPEELATLLGLERSGGEGDLDQLFDWVAKYLRFSVNTAHPGYFNRMWVQANMPSVLGEMVTALTNTSACTFEAAPVSTLMERYMLAQMLELVGFVDGVGLMTTGSSNANMVAMMAARNVLEPTVKAQGMPRRGRLLAFVNREAHYSMDKAANILGLGMRNLIKVAVDERGRMVPEELARHLEQAVERGQVPFFVAATAGTTVRGAYDPIEPLVSLRKQYGFWLHVDGAWGGSAVLSPSLRSRYLQGLEEADSFTWDFHKMLGTALMCNVLLFNRRPKVLSQVLTGGDESYIFHNPEEEVRDLGTNSLQCGRRVDSLKWFLDWKYFGREGFARRVERSLALCTYAEQRVIEAAELELVSPRESFNVCFRYRVDSTLDANAFNLELRTALYRAGRYLVGYAYIEGILVLRLLLTSPDRTEADVDQFLAAVCEAGRRLLGEHGQVHRASGPPRPVFSG